MKTAIVGAAHPVPLHVEDAGVGTVVVLMHGFGGSARNFRPQVRALSEECRVVTFDARGHARSGVPAEPEAYEIAAFIDDVGRVIGQTGAQRVLLGGLSMGAGIALRYALAHPETVSGLLLAAFPPAGDPSPTGWAMQFADALDARGLDAAGAQFVWGGDRFDPRAAQLIRTGFREHQPRALASTLRRLLATHPSVDALERELKKIDFPTRVVVGSQDTRCIDSSERIAGAIPTARFDVIDGAGHVVNLTKVQSFNGSLRDLLGEIEATPSR